MEEAYQQGLEARAHALLNLKDHIDQARNVCIGDAARKAKRGQVKAAKEVSVRASRRPPRPRTHLRM